MENFKKNKGAVEEALQLSSWLENEFFEDAFPIENEDFPSSYVSLPEGRSPSGWLQFFGSNKP